MGFMDEETARTNLAKQGSRFVSTLKSGLVRYNFVHRQDLMKIY